MHTITKVHNNNIVSAVDATGEELILAGAGVGFGASKGDTVDTSRVEREFRLAGDAQNGTFRVLLDLPYPVVQTTAHISRLLERTYGIRLPPAVEVGLADHLATSIRRMDEGIPVFNSMLWETKMTYPSEFAVALHVLDLVHDELGRKLPLDEAGFVTLHLVNAGVVGDPDRTLTLGASIRRVVAIVREDLGIEVDGATTASARFLTHVKFVIQRLTRNRAHSEATDEYYRALIAEHPRLYACATRIGQYLDDTLQAGITDEERVYLLLHLITLEAEQHSAAETPRAQENPARGYWSS